jgi:Putative Flp pilus-assembly TadE/G-like
MKMPSRTPLQARRGDPHGQVLVLFALMLVVLLLVSALAVDYGGWLVTKRNYQNSTDAAALAGAQQLTRAQTAGCANKNYCAREAAWQSVKSALGLTGLDPVVQATNSSGANSPYQANGYKVWVASPPADAGAAYPGHVSGPGVVFVRVDHAGMDYLSRIVSTNRTVSAWSTAGRFAADYAVIGMCSPTSITANCLAGDANIKLDGTNTNLIVGTGDLGTNRWVKDGGSNSGVALGPDSNAYMQLFDTCWANVSNSCQLWGYNSPNIDTSTTRAAIPLGAPIPDPAYAAPPITSTTAPNECRGSGTVQLASTQILERNQADSQVADLPIKLASVVQPVNPGPIPLAANSTVSGTVLYAGVGVPNMTVEVMNGASVVQNGTTNASGNYSLSTKNGTGYTIRITDNTAGGPVYHQTSTAAFDLSANYTAPTITLQKNPVVSGTVTSSLGGALNNVSITITVQGVDYTTTTNASGFYTKIIPFAGNMNYVIVGTLFGYTSGGTSVNAPTAYDTNYPNMNFTLTPAPASLTGTITDAVANPTNLPVPGVTVTLGTGQTTTTDASGSYNFPSVVPGTTTITLSGTAMVGYAYATPLSPLTYAIAVGANTRNFTLWPKGCYDGNSSGSFGSWSCSWPSGNNCPSTTSPDASDGSLTCAFTQANAIRPGTYNNITLPNNTCAWLDPKGGATGLATGQMAGIYHIKGTISMGNNSYLFGDGVTIVMDQGSNFDVNNGGGFVLNYGTIKVGGAATCAHPTDFATAKAYNDGTNPCFQTVAYDGQDYAYAAWTTGATSPWQTNSGSGCVQASPPVYNTTSTAVGNARCFTPGKDLGITFYMYGSGLGTNSRMKLATSSMGYLFNGVLYAPNDDVQLGGGKDGQTAAGQIVGWTIEYHGGTRILQNWYGDPLDGQPFLIEPVLGE